MEKSQFNSIYKDEYKKSTGLLFIRTYHKWHGLIKNKLRTIDLTHPQFVVLTTLAALLRQQEWVSQTEHHTSNGYGAAKGQPSPSSGRRH